EEVEDPIAGVIYRTLSPWKSLTWRVVANSTPDIVQFELARDTLSGFGGVSWATGVQPIDRITSDPTLAGRVANDNGAELMRVEFDHDGDGIVDGFAVTDAQGAFKYVPAGLTVG